jgi:lipopolysaccharide transport system ATP-binding protein
MSDVVVRARDLSKVYRLYPSQTDRLADLLGWSWLRRAVYPEHKAVDGINLEVRAGERVGLIGRNGAGKSTLLKLITGVTQPSSGELTTTGETHALLQMGAGFQPEFTGRENARAYLANLGVIGESADRQIEDIIEFSELEEYIDQPLRTYSTGMAMRLVFAVSTAIAPSLFVVDEVLGVGDAYFQAKSFDRIKSLCSDGTTLLLVSHDIYSAARLCERMIWIERGQIQFDGDPKAAINLYEASIKTQEEQRLRKKARIRSSTNVNYKDTDIQQFLLEIRPKDQHAFEPSIELRQATLVANGKQIATVGLHMADAKQASVNLVFEGACWKVEDSDTRSPTITLANHGSSFHKGLLDIRVPRNLSGVSLVFKMFSPESQSIHAVLFDEQDRAYVGLNATLPAGELTEWTVPIDPSVLVEREMRVDQPDGERHGSGALRIMAFDILDKHRESVRLLQLGEPVTFRINYKINNRDSASDVEASIVFYKDSVTDVMRIFASSLELSVDSDQGVIELYLERLPLCFGSYTISFIFAKKGYYEENSGRAFSINRDVYDVLSRAVEFTVPYGNPAFTGSIVAYEGQWKVLPVLSQLGTDSALR